MKITIISAYTWFNKGDAGILLGTLEALKSIFPNAEYNILSFTPETDRVKYAKEFSGIKSVESNLLNPYPLNKTKFGKIKAIIKLGIEKIIQDILFSISKQWYTQRYQSADLIKNSDIVFVCGGGFLGGKKFNSLIHLHQISKACKLNSNVVLWGTSIEPPTNKRLKKITENSIGKLSKVLPREDVTETYLHTFLPSNMITKTPDLAFNLGTKTNSTIKAIVTDLKKEGKMLIGITIRDWNFPKSKFPLEDKQNYFETICGIIEQKVKNNYKFVFIPQVIFKGDDDRVIANKVYNNLSDSGKKGFVILEGDFSPGELKGLISNMDLFLGTRMHSNIFATSVNIPTLAIAYEKKTNGIMEKLNMGSYVVDIEDVSIKVLLNKLEDLEKNSEEVKFQLDKQTKKFKAEINDIGRVLKSEVKAYDNNRILKRAH